MIKLDLASLRPQLDLEGKYVDFSLLRTTLTVAKVVGDLDINLSAPSKEGESRGTCPKCGKDRSFALNINTNRFNCFNKGCILKGGGVIDLFAKLYEVPAKEASHLLACVYGIQPYTQSPAQEQPTAKKTEKPAVAEAVMAAVATAPPKRNRETITRMEFDELQAQVERLSQIIWSLMFEGGEIDEDAPAIFDEREEDYELEAVLSV